MVTGGIIFAAALFSLVDCSVIIDPRRPPSTILYPTNIPESNHELYTQFCTYSDFSEWKLSSFKPVPTYQCVSGFVVVETRVKTVLSGDCDDQTEERTSECKNSIRCKHDTQYHTVYITSVLQLQSNLNGI